MSTPTIEYGDRRRGLVDRRAACAPVARSHEGIRVSWGGIWAGVLATGGLLLLLSALGIAIGISAADRGAGVRVDSATGIYAVAILLFSLFMGGLVSTRAGAIHDRATSFWEGGMVWIVSIVLVGFLAAGGVSSLVGGSFAVLGHALAPVMESGAPERAAWMTFAGLSVTLLASVAGAMAGRRRRRRPR